MKKLQESNISKSLDCHKKNRKSFVFWECNHKVNEEKIFIFLTFFLNFIAAVLAKYLEITWNEGNKERPAIVELHENQGQNEIPLKQLVCTIDGVKYKVVPFNDLYDNCNSVLPLLNKVRSYNGMK